MKKYISFLFIPLIVLGLAAAPPLPARESGDEIGDVVILGINSVYLRPNSDIRSGNVVVNDASPGPALADGYELVCNKATTHWDVALKADGIWLKSNADVRGDVYYNDLAKSSNSRIHGDEYTPLELPVFPELPLFYSMTPGVEDVEVPKNESIVLPPGDYGDITVKKGANIRFTGGAYNVRSIKTTGKWSELLFEAPSVILVAEGIKTANQVYVGSAVKSQKIPFAPQIVFHVAGIYDAAGERDPSPKAVDIGVDSEIFANFYVPNGTFRFRNGTIAYGAFFAMDVDVGSGCRIDLSSGLTLPANLAPTPADDSFSMLRGETFDSVAAGLNLLDNDTDPNPGSLLAVTEIPGVRPLYGDITLNADGSFIYTHHGESTDQDSIIYEVCDNGEPVLCSSAEITVAITDIPPNQPPVADPQYVDAGGDENLQIILTGSDPEQDDLAFSIEIEPTQGSLSDPIPIVPDPIGSCSVTREICLDFVNSTDCPAPEDICEARPAPPVTSATVTYTPDAGGALEDNFTFKVEDGAGLTGMASVLINSPGETPGPSPVDAVAAYDVLVETVTDAPAVVALDAEAPEGTTLVYTVRTLPAGALTDSDEQAIATAPYILPGPTVTYTPPPGFTGPDGFEYEAAGVVGGVVESDTASVSVKIDPPFELAEDQEATARVNGWTEITLIGASGGAGDGGGGGSRIHGHPTRRAAFLLPADVVGAATDNDGDGFGDSVATGDQTSIDFETPALDLEESARGFVPAYTHGGVVFTAESAGTLVPVIGLVKNSATSACVEPSNDDQKLGSGTAAANIGFSGFTIRAQFPSPLPVGSVVTASFQTGYSKPIRLRLFDALGQETGSATGVASPADGTCGYPGNPRARTTLGATSSTGSTLYAVMDAGSTPNSVVFVIDDFSFDTGAGEFVSAGIESPEEKRIQIEWDISNFSIDPAELMSATVTVHTEKGENDSLDTTFFAGAGEQDGVLTASDFEAEVKQIPGASMPVPDDPVGATGTFSFDVQNALLDAINGDAPLDIFSIQGRVDPEDEGQGLQVSVSPPPTLDVTTPGVIMDDLEFSIMTLPAFGLLKDSSGSPVQVGIPLPGPTVTFVSGGQMAVVNFTYKVTQGVIVDTGVVTITILNDNCIENGRLPGCSPTP